MMKGSNKHVRDESSNSTPRLQMITTKLLRVMDKIYVPTKERSNENHSRTLRGLYAAWVLAALAPTMRLAKLCCASCGLYAILVLASASSAMTRTERCGSLSELRAPSHFAATPPPMVGAEHGAALSQLWTPRGVPVRRQIAQATSLRTCIQPHTLRN